MRNFIEESKLHSETLGFDLSQVEQGSSQWHRSRAGVITASKAHVLLMEDKLSPFPEDVEIIKDGRDNHVLFKGKAFTGTKANCIKFVRELLPRIQSDTKMTYMDELLASVATGLLPEEIRAKPLQWGKDHEESARDAYSAATFEGINETGFIYQDDSMRCGISPDGLIAGLPKGLELKCPYNSGVFMAFAGRGKIKKEEEIQVQFSLMVTGFESWGFAKFDPRNINCKKLHFIEIKRDEVMIEQLRAGAESFIAEMDIALKNLGMEFGQQWNNEF